MENTTPHLTGELNAAVRSAATRQGVSEAEVIRQSIHQMVGVSQPGPSGGLSSSGQSIARRANELLAGFGER